MVIVFILIVGFILRLINLNQSLWLDEAVQVVTSKGPFLGIFAELQGDFHPPLYHFLMWGWAHLFGNGEIAIRLPSVFFGTATIYIVYLIAKEISLANSFTSQESKSLLRHLRGVSFACLAALFLATAPFHIYYSQEARMYSVGTFLAAGSFYFFLKLLKSDKGRIKENKGNTLGYLLFTLLALYTDYYAFFVLLAQWIFLLIKKRYLLLFYSLALLLFYLPWLPMLYKQLQFGIQATNILPEWGRLVNLSFLKALPLTFIKFSLGRITIFNKTAYGSIAVILGIFYVYLLFKGIKRWLKDGKGNLIVVLLWLLVPLGFAWIASLFVPNYQPFRLLLVLPAFYLLLTMGIEGLGERRIRGVIIVTVLIINLASLSVYYFNPYFHREDWRGVVGYLQQQKEISVVLPSGTSAWPLKYYDPNNKINLISTNMGISKIEGEQLTVVGNQLSLANKRIYYIRYLVPLFDPAGNIETKLGELGYNKIEEKSFNQIPVWEYQLTD